MWNSKTYIVGERKRLIVFDVNLLDCASREIIDNNLVKICEGRSDSNLSSVKKRLLNFLSTKSSETSFGAVAEFFLHLLLVDVGFKQDFLFFNLEENSIKKGFDGVFTYKNNPYFLESKSSFYTSKVVSHKSNIKLAHKDLVSYMSGKSKKGRNNPWRNAYNHASHIDVGSRKPLRDKLRDIAKLYDSGEFQNPSEFNLIPCSTIFVSTSNLEDFNCDIVNSNSFLQDLEGKVVLAICLTNSTYNVFLNYLGEESGE